MFFCCPIRPYQPMPFLSRSLVFPQSAPGSGTSTSNSGTGTPGTEDKKPPSTTANVSVSGDEASDSGCAGPGEGSEGSAADVKCPTKELVSLEVYVLPQLRPVSPRVLILPTRAA